MLILTERPFFPRRIRFQLCHSFIAFFKVDDFWMRKWHLFLFQNWLQLNFFFSSLPLWPRVVSLVSSSDMKCNIVNWNSNLLWSSMCTDNNTCFHNSRWQENCLKLKIILNFYNTTEYWCSNSSIKVKGGNETVGFVFLDERNPRLTRVNPVASFSFSPHVILSRQVCRCNF